LDLYLFACNFLLSAIARSHQNTVDRERNMYFHFEPLATITATATAIFLISTIKFRWFRPDNYLPAPFNVVVVEEIGYCYCAVCLDEVSGGDKCRQLPKCGHASLRGRVARVQLDVPNLQKASY
ncbi:hypothetical protein AABB24_022048, partial [Solanum stoloniferum]